MKFEDFRAHCLLNGDDIAAVDKFIAWVRQNIHIWQYFEECALAEMRAHEKGSPMRVMANMRESKKVMVPNAMSPGLARMFNCKYRRRFFQVNRMRTFSEKEAA